MIDEDGRRRARGGGGREGRDPLGAHLRVAPRRLRASATAATSPPGAWSSTRRGGRRHRRAVDRRAGHAAHPAHLPHRRRGEPSSSSSRRSRRKADGKLEFARGPEHGPRPRTSRRTSSTSATAARSRSSTPTGRRPSTGTRRRYGAGSCVADGAAVDRGRRCSSSGTPTTLPIVAREKRHRRASCDIKEKVTVRDEIDETTGQQLPVIVEDREKILQPHIDILDERAESHRSLPAADRRAARRAGRAAVRIGEVLAKIRRDVSQDPRHHRRSAARRRAVRGAQAEGCGDRSPRSTGVVRVRARSPAACGRSWSETTTGDTQRVPDPAGPAALRAGRRLRGPGRRPADRGPDQPARHPAGQGDQRGAGVPGRTRSRRSTGSRACASTTSTSR